MADPVPPPPAAKAADPTPAAPFTPEQVNVINQMIDAKINPPQMDDSAMPAMMAHVEAKIVKAVDKRFSESETKVATLAEAAFTKQIGNSPALLNFHKESNAVNPLQTAITAQLAAGAPNRGVAIARALKDKPELEEFRATLK